MISLEVVEVSYSQSGESSVSGRCCAECAGGVVVKKKRRKGKEREGKGSGAERKIEWNEVGKREKRREMLRKEE